MRMSLAVYSQAVQFLSVAAHMCLSPSCTLAQCCSHSIAGMARASERNRSTPKQNFLQPRLRLARYNFCHILLGESRYKGGQIQSLGKQTTLRWTGGSITWQRMWDEQRIRAIFPTDYKILVMNEMHSISNYNMRSVFSPKLMPPS